MPAGRPTEYAGDETVQRLDAYLAALPEDEVVPTVEGFGDLIGISKVTLYAWGEKYPEFLNALERLKTKQGKMLQNSGLSGKFQQPITKLMLSANHGMAERSEQKNEHSGNVTLVTKIPEPSGAKG